ncbi:MAG: hypothetical protein QM765_34620 [Myxococcales bacterium]
MNRIVWALTLVALAAPLSGCPNQSTPKVECSTPADCAKPTNECVVATCEANKCGTGNVAANKALAQQAAGDCAKVVCDGQGKSKTVNDDADILDDGNPCTDDTCESGTPMSNPSPAGTDCSASGTGTKCDGRGNCVSGACGNGALDSGEACDGLLLNGKTCQTQASSTARSPARPTAPSTPAPAPARACVATPPSTRARPATAPTSTPRPARPRASRAAR